MSDPSRQGAKTTQIRVVIADDHPMLREGIHAILAAETDIEVVGTAASGADAVRVVGELRPDVVLMDVSMPGMDGYEATAEIGRTSPDTRVIILTMYEDEQHFHPGLQAGAAGFVVKSGASRELIDAIRSVANGQAFLHPAVAKYVLPGTNSRGRGSGLPDGEQALTKREWEVLGLVAHGYTSREIADRLYVSLKTVETHRERIMLKLNFRTRAELVRFAISKGLLTDAPDAD